MQMSRDLVGGLGTSIIGTVYYYYASQLRVSALDDSFGPAGLPKTYGLIMIVLGLAIATDSLLRARRNRAAGIAPQAQWTGQGQKILRAAGLLCIGIAYLLLVNWAGYAISIALLLMATALYRGAPPSWRVLAVSVGGAAALWGIFVLLLGVSMPSGVLLPG
ncbi:tripartite tricarboxylate transporter TctB family protein [uncultured Limimaricola sp.]|uniref:tripartite tricarboxylate transporter TctB family protein n=1 Tax=uncultured Limimaricola sp. TaxID=2211667 RepID=UPI0030F88ACB